MVLQKSIHCICTPSPQSPPPHSQSTTPSPLYPPPPPHTHTHIHTPQALPESNFGFFFFFPFSFFSGTLQNKIQQKRSYSKTITQQALREFYLACCWFVSSMQNVSDARRKQITKSATSYYTFRNAWLFHMTSDRLRCAGKCWECK